MSNIDRRMKKAQRCSTEDIAVNTDKTTKMAREEIPFECRRLRSCQIFTSMGSLIDTKIEQLFHIVVVSYKL